MKISEETRDYLNSLRGVSILRVVLGHLGLFWLFPPYSEFFHALLPLLFFVSGAVSYGSYLRSTSNGSYLYRRMISIATPYYAIIAIAVIGGLALNQQASLPMPDSLLRLILIIPKNGDLFFPIGQVWFIHAMIVIVVLSLPFFILSKASRKWLLPPIVISLLLGAAEFSSSIYRELFLAGHNMYQPIANAGFFFLGALYITYTNHPKMLRTALTAALFCALGAAALPYSFQIEIGLASHSYAPDIYYLLCSFFAVATIIAMRNIILSVLYRLTYIRLFLDYTSTHAYSIFMTHSFFIFACEKWLGLLSVKESPITAATKIALVVGASWMTAPIATALTKNLSSLLLPKFRNRLMNESASSEHGPR
ncbi:MAG: acyltransferase [Gammaproteobacteria bacterium]|nr:acyltransferase [Gammaproteobacteria bacterium]